MGGTLILLALTLATLLWADLPNGYVWVVLLITLGFGGIGFVDDYLKLTGARAAGCAAAPSCSARPGRPDRRRAGSLRSPRDPLATGLALPFFKDLLVPLGLLFFPFAMLVMVGASNAVNLTDGLDGLAIVPAMIVAACFALIAYLVGNAIFADYLGIPFVPGTGELAVFCGALVGASLGFLWFNAPPAMVFMGDTGSLASGGALGAVAVITKHELVLRRRRRPVRARDGVGDRSGRLVQADRQAGVPDGAAAPPLRAEGLGGADHRDPLLDHRHGAGADRPVDPEAAVSGR